MLCYKKKIYGYYKGRCEAKKHKNILQFTRHVLDCSNPSSVAKYDEKPLDTSIEYINRKGINVMKRNDTVIEKELKAYGKVIMLNLLI